jgi:hypothetical protein
MQLTQYALSMSEVENKKCVVKVQQSLAHNIPDEGTQVFVYDKEKDFMYQGPMPDELQKIIGNRPKIYCNAELMPNLDDEGQPLGTFQFAIMGEVEEQPW